jgi:1-deoxy-D-xylulose-5-phosphate reductoisomerase
VTAASPNSLADWQTGRLAAQKRVALLGSTGSIGRQALDVIRAYPERFKVVGLAAGQNVDLLAEQAAEFRPAMVACLNPEALNGRFEGDYKPAIVNLREMATDPEADIVLSGVVGKDGLAPALAALEAGKVVALANKEAMVMAGNLLVEAARRGGGEIRPVDSEHSALWQCLTGEDRASIRRLVLTASGGALRNLPVEALADVTPEQALAHPTWQMGRRITIDSATLFNKGLEVIEARWLFDVPFERIEVLLHRESIIHSLVEYGDGSFKAHLSWPDMRQPIQYALSYPERLNLELPAVDFAQMGALHFGELDRERYPCLGIALAAGARGGTCPAAIAAADEEAVGAFLDGRIGFIEIPALLADTLDSNVPAPADSLDAVMEADAWGRRYALHWIKARSAVTPLRAGT